MYTEQLNLNEQATNLQLGIMEALTDPLLNRDMEHTIESIFDVTSENSLLLDHTFDIIPIYLNKAPFLLLKPSYCLNLNLLPQRGARCLLENGFSYTKHRIRGNIVQWQCVQRGMCNARIRTRNQIVVNRINEHNH